MRKYDIDYIKRKGKRIIEDYKEKGIGWSIIPGVSSLALNPLIISMISEINRMAGIDPSKDFASDLFTIIFLPNIIFTPFASIPLLGMAVVRAGIEKSGEEYLEFVIRAAEKANETFEPIEKILKNILKSGDIPKIKM